MTRTRMITTTTRTMRTASTQVATTRESRLG